MNRIQKLERQLAEANRRLDDVWSTLYGQGLSVLGWHLNGDPKPMDEFFEQYDHDWEPVEEDWDE
jgi:hypothetical protein